jgi:hypothetical protein
MEGQILISTEQVNDCDGYGKRAAAVRTWAHAKVQTMFPGDLFFIHLYREYYLYSRRKPKPKPIVWKLL